MELVRVDGGPKIAESLYTGNFTGDYDTIVVHDAPAYQIEYDSISSMDPGFTWNRTESKGDCQMFGADIGEGIYICLRETGDSIHLGIFLSCFCSRRYQLTPINRMDDLSRPERSRWHLPSGKIMDLQRQVEYDCLPL